MASTSLGLSAANKDVAASHKATKFEIRMGRTILRCCCYSLLSERLSWLSRLAFYPAVCRHRILPEILLCRLRPFGGEVFADDFQFFGIGRPGIAVGPVAAINQPVFAEDLPELIQPGPIKTQIVRHPAIHPAKYFRDFDVNLLALSQFPQIGFILAARR